MEILPENKGSRKPSNWFSVPTIRFRMVNHGNMSLAIEAGLAAINWPTGCCGGRDFIHALLALLNGRQTGRVIADHQTVARLMSRGHLSDAAQRTFVSRQIAGFHRIAECLNRTPIVIESGTCKGNATRYDLRPLLKFALAVLGKYDELKTDARSFNPSAAIFSLIPRSLIYIPVFTPQNSPLPVEGSDVSRKGSFPPNNRVPHLAYQIRQQSSGFARKLEGHDFERWVSLKMRIVLARAKKGRLLLPLHYITSPGVCSCSEGRRCKRQGKHPYGKLVRHGVEDATSDPDTLRQWFIHEPFCNVGMVTKDELIVDIDFKNGGHYSLRSLEAAYSKIPRTYREKSGHGRHHHFERPDFPVRTTQSELGKGIDVIVDSRHYVVIAPSFTVDAYRVEDDRPLATVPEWLLDLMLRNDPYVREPGVKIKQGHRNYWLWTQGVQILQRENVSEVELEERLWCLYQTECEAGTDPINKREIKRIRVGCFQRIAKLRRERAA